MTWPCRVYSRGTMEIDRSHSYRQAVEMTSLLDPTFDDAELPLSPHNTRRARGNRGNAAADLHGAAGFSADRPEPDLVEAVMLPPSSLESIDGSRLESVASLHVRTSPRW